MRYFEKSALLTDKIKLIINPNLAANSVNARAIKGRGTLAGLLIGGGLSGHPVGALGGAVLGRILGAGKAAAMQARAVAKAKELQEKAILTSIGAAGLGGGAYVALKKK